MSDSFSCVKLTKTVKMTRLRRQPLVLTRVGTEGMVPHAAESMVPHMAEGMVKSKVR